MGIIKIEGIRLHAYHGCLDEEAKIGTEYCVDCTLETDFEKAAISDDLRYTVDYVKVYEIVREEMAIRAKLIEHVAKRIYVRIKQVYPEIKTLEVRLAKSNPPANGYFENAVVIYTGS